MTLQVCFQETREGVTTSAAKGHISKLVQILFNKPSKGAQTKGILTICLELGYY